MMILRTDIVRPLRDDALEEVVAELVRLDPQGLRWSQVFRHTYDMVYNGQQTGRYRWDQLMKTEKTHFGTLFEINAQREFRFEDGEATDYRIAGHQVDAKWSQKLNGWMLPPEVFDEIALVATADDAQSVWSLGLVRVSEEVRRVKANRDQKTQLNGVGRASIRWLWEDAPLRPNVLLQIPRADVDAMLNLSSGNRKVSQLFRLAEGRIVHRNAVATVAQQLDAQKRVRGNGGARDTLQPEGYLVMSGIYHQRVARQLGLPVPLKDEYISARVVPADKHHGVEIGGTHWRLARPGDEISTPAPTL